MTSPDRIAAEVRTVLGATNATHRPNHTGAGKLSFAVERAGSPLWVRVAADQDEDAALRRWAAWTDRLERYAAPPVLDVLTVAGRTALVQPHLPEPVATRETLPAEALLKVLADLHADADLAARLGPPVTARAAFRAVWLDRFVADLEIVEGYVERDDHAWLADQVEALADLLTSPAFDEAVHAPTHGDPWHENVLVRPEGLWLLDWEDLAVGDPVVDEAIVLNDACGPDSDRWPTGERYDVARRCLVLDGIVDVAADWVQATDPLVRVAKEAAYRSALAAALEGRPPDTRL